MSKIILKQYGLVQCAKFQIIDKTKCEVEILDETICSTDRAIYVWMIDDKIVRIGSSKGILKNRLTNHGKWIEKRLKNPESFQNERGRKELADAHRWLDALISCKVAIAWGRSGTIVNTPVGELNTYLAEENFLLEKHKPPLNNSHFR
jgi:hypothetical protein